MEKRREGGVGRKGENEGWGERERRRGGEKGE